ncbi:unnamed protein product [Spirodela intermedia]|uniref:Uncharacterized protein n=1 Tax=Spirodela intermedia TaxID=51605 RepID=A0A7I8IGW8_SPIIN|nr:unnamed protein product [Spirodela intermedia]CAA6656102.1 unnamed protein product [Spirodela intermedia]
MRSVHYEARMTLLEEEQEAGNYAMQLASATVLPMTLKAAIELNLLEIISRAGSGAQLLPEEIVVQLPTENPAAVIMVDRILRLLASYSILTCSVVDGDGGKVRRRYGLALSHGQGFYGELVLLKGLSSAGGNPFNKAYGMTLFEYLGTDPRFNNVFNASMSNYSTITMNKMLEIYQGLDGFGVLVDVGGGVGATLNMIISKHQSIKGINFDLPHVIADAPSFPGVEHRGGDMFESVPSGDAIFMKSILHNWSDEHCLKVLKNCWNALPEQGKVIVVERILPEAPETTRNAQGLFHMDLIMLVQTPGGKERTEKEFESLAKGAGSRVSRR